MKAPSTVLSLSLFATLLTPNAFASRNAGSDLMTMISEKSPEATSLFEDAALRPVNYAQPPLGCVEEMVPHRAARECLDLSDVAKPYTDWPSDISSEEKAYWWKERRGLNVCRMEEILRRERSRPGSQLPFHLEMAWMTMDSLRNYETKVKAVYDGARANNIPLQVFAGAIYQESLFSELGIADDGGNFSCGMQQINLIGWCGYMNKRSAEEKTAMGWPQEAVDCADKKIIELEFIRPVYNIAKTRLRGLPEYRLRKEHFQNIPLSSVVNKWPAADQATQQKRYSLIQAYVNNCSDPRHGIMAKGNELANVYDLHISATGFAQKDRYAAGEKFNRKCREEQVGDAYPLHTGWLMVVASYNAGPRAIDAAAYYENWSLDDLNNPSVMKNYTPNDLVKGLYWGGKYNPENDLIEYPWLKRPGTTRQWPFFKACVAQRHIARVMQHMTLTPDFFVDTLEGSWGCQRGSFATGGPSGTPKERQRSSGSK